MEGGLPLALQFHTLRKHTGMKLSYTLTILLIILAQHLSAQTIVYVANGATGVGTSWLDATSNLALAMSSAQPNTEIWVKQGNYYPTSCASGCSDAERMVSFEMKPGVKIIGGFIGNETSSVQASASNLTVLSGDIGVSGDNTDNSYNVLSCLACGAEASVRNIRVTGGFANRLTANGPSERGRAGAGLYIDATAMTAGASPTIIDCEFIENDVIGRGGAIYINAFNGLANPNFQFCKISLNTSKAEGGAIGIDGPQGTVNLSLSDCELSNNGTVYSSGSSQSGGAIFMSAQGGSTNINIARCLFKGNSADVATPSSSTGNQNGLGGAIYITNSSSGSMALSISNTLFSNNSAYSAGAIYNLGGVTNLTNVTLNGNQAVGSGGSGGALYVNGGSATIVNSIFWNNPVPQNPFGGRDIRFVNGTVNISYTLVEAADRAALFSPGSPSGNVLNDGPGMIYGQDPLFNSGGSVAELQSTSPAINAGDTLQAVTAGGDYFGATRIQHGYVDLGAVESSSAPLPVSLIRFVAKPTGMSVQLDWLVASESNLSGYRLMRSDDAKSFVEVAQIPAMGEGDYGYRDQAVLAGALYYYRLVSEDFDGTSYDSELVTARLEDGKDSDTLFSRVYPNPTAGEIRVTLVPREGARTVYATVIDVTGRKLRMWPLTSDGEHILDLSDLADGQYIVRIAEGTRLQTASFVVKH